MRGRPILLCLLFASAAWAGCLSGDEVSPDTPAPMDTYPYLGYIPVEPDLDLSLLETDHHLPGADGVEIHVRIVRPDGPGPFPVIAQFTPYTAPGQNVLLNQLGEPAGCQFVSVPSVTGFPVSCEGGFDHLFARRGYAFAYADVRGTGDSTGCLDLRGDGDIADAAHLIEFLASQEWSNGNIGFIGASYPGSEAHMAGIAAALYDKPQLKAIVPIVASTSFYHYHHNSGVPYMGQHSLGGTNTGYTRNAVSPTVNPQHTNYLTRYVEEAQCPTADNVLVHGGLDQSGAYYDWWQERNLRDRAAMIEVPVLMAQGLADWNVKPDHIATWFNDLQVRKTLIAGQWGHAYPYSTCDEDSNRRFCDDLIPYGNWWEYVNAFFDTFLKEVDTGMFQEDVAWVQDATGQWHRSTAWPLLPAERTQQVLHLGADGTLAETAAEDAEASWYGCAYSQGTYGHFRLRQVRSATYACDTGGVPEQLVFKSEPFVEDAIISGVPLVNLTVKSDVARTHLVALMEVIDEDGTIVQRTVRDDVKLTTRENYGYLNPVYRRGLDVPEDIPVGEAYTVSIDLYPQEDVVRAGESIRLTIRSSDEGRTIEEYDPGVNTLVFGPDMENALWLPLRPLELQGLRAPEVDDADAGAAPEVDQASS